MMTRQQLLEEQEAKVIAALAAAEIAEQLIPVTEADLAPGLVLIYKLGEGYGSHIVRSKQDIAAGCKPYRKSTDLRGAAKDGQFFTLPDNLEL